MRRYLLGWVSLGVLLAGCVTSSTDFVAKDQESRVVTLGAGTAVVSSDDESGWRLWYIIDPSTQTCWFKIGDSVGALDCCQLWRVDRAQRFLTWVSGAKCAARLANPQPAPRQVESD